MEFTEMDALAYRSLNADEYEQRRSLVIGLAKELPEDATVVSVVTGNGLKDVANAIKACGEPISIPSDMELLIRALPELS